MHFKFVISFVILVVIAFVQADNEQAGEFDRLQNAPLNRPLTISEMIAIIRSNPDSANSQKFDPKVIFQAPILCPQGEHLDNKGRCRKFLA